MRIANGPSFSSTAVISASFGELCQRQCLSEREIIQISVEIQSSDGNQFALRSRSETTETVTYLHGDQNWIGLHLFLLFGTPPVTFCTVNARSSSSKPVSTTYTLSKQKRRVILLPETFSSLL